MVVDVYYAKGCVNGSIFIPAFACSQLSIFPDKAVLQLLTKSMLIYILCMETLEVKKYNYSTKSRSRSD
jgi:cadmium resistance protein CadD (predicted permease)